MYQAAPSFGLIIIGGGPGGLSPLLAAHHTGDLESLLAKGVAIVDQADELGAGTIGNHCINSDSSGRTFVDCLLGPNETELTKLAEHDIARQLAAAGDGAVALRDAGRFLSLVGGVMRKIVSAHERGEVLLRHKAVSAQQTAAGWQVKVVDMTTGEERLLTASNVVTATGAHQPLERLAQETVGGFNLMERCGDRLIQSGDVFSQGGLDSIANRLAGKDEPRVIIIGGSTSAAAVAHALLHRLPQITFKAGGLTMLHRRPLRIFYLDRESALAEGYDEWTEDDVCPISGRVFRFAGFRLDSRELVMQARGIGGRPPEPRLHLHHLQDVDPAAMQMIDEADLVISALGYRPRGIPVLDGFGAPIRLLSETGPQQPLVDGQCRVLDASGQPIDGLFGIGLAAGFVPRGALGGELSFRGQANGLWLWQHDVGALIVDAVIRTDPASRQSQGSIDAVIGARQLATVSEGE
jgi:hypothetical protein